MKTTQQIFRRSVIYGALLGACGLAPAAVNAQGSPLVLEEVIVTAQKREESMQEVPVSVTAITAEMIEQAGIQTSEDIIRVAPSLTFTGNIGKQGQAFSLRGIGTNTFGINIEQSVAFIVDDVATVQQGESIDNLSDIERIEVLRGPQSTLFGKSASAGAIVITTRAPSEEFEGMVEGTVTDDEEYRLAGSLSGPLGDRWSYRLSGYWTDREGYITNLYNGDDQNGTENHGLRGKLRWDISATVDATLTAYYNKEEDTCCALTFREQDPDAKLFGQLEFDKTGIVPGDDNDKVRWDISSESETETKGGNLRFNVAFGEYTLMSITAYNRWEYTRITDVDGTTLDIGPLVGGESGGMYEVPYTESEFFSQEFRLLSPSFERYEYLVGLYYADAETDNFHERNIEPAIPFAQALTDATAGTETAALFGQLTWHLTDATSVTGGLRYHYEEISAKYRDLLQPEPDTISGKDDDDEVVGKLSLQHFLGEETMLFASYATGYKGQAFDVSTDFNEEKAQNPVKPETSESIELGIKSKLWDRRLLFNATLYWAQYDDFQAQATRLEDFDLGAIPQFNLVNVGELQTSGIEVETTALLTESLTFTLNAAYMDAEVNDYVGAGCWPTQSEAEGCVDGFQNIDGGELPAAPEWKFAAFLDYTLYFDSLPFDGFAGINYSWQDDVIYDINQDPSLYQDAYGIANLRLGIEEKSGRYMVTAFVNNLFDEQYASGMRNGAPLYGGADSFSQMLSRNAFRYWGVNARYNF